MDNLQGMAEGADRWRQMGNVAAALFGPEILQTHEWERIPSDVWDQLLAAAPEEVLNPPVTGLFIGGTVPTSGQPGTAGIPADAAPALGTNAPYFADLYGLPRVNYPVMESVMGGIPYHAPVGSEADQQQNASVFAGVFNQLMPGVNLGQQVHSFLDMIGARDRFLQLDTQ